LTKIGVVGGGIAGIGLALTATKLGHKVTLFEKDQCLKATSANSLRIIHGGFRYLQNLNLSLSVESIRAQTELLQLAPQFIRQLDCYLLLSEKGLKRAGFARIGILIFKALAKISANKDFSAKLLAAERLNQIFPMISDLPAKPALHWQDALIEDLEGFHQMLLSLCVSQGVELRENTEVVKVGNVAGNPQIELATGERLNFERVYNCAPSLFRLIDCSWCLGINLNLTKQLDPSRALSIDSKENRSLFFVPRGKGTSVGTWYFPLNSAVGRSPTAVELARCIAEINGTLPSLSLDLSQVESLDAGVLPCATGSSNPTLRSECKKEGGYIEVLTCKYTTFLTKAREVLAESN